jgi:hypothetical protein
MPNTISLNLELLDLVQTLALAILLIVLIRALHLFRLELRKAGEALHAVLAAVEALRLRQRDVEMRMDDLEKRRGKPA